MYALLEVFIATMLNHLPVSVADVKLTPVFPHPSPKRITGFAAVPPPILVVPKKPSLYVLPPVFHQEIISSCEPVAANESQFTQTSIVKLVMVSY